RNRAPRPSSSSTRARATSRWSVPTRSMRSCERKLGSIGSSARGADPPPRSDGTLDLGYREPMAQRFIVDHVLFVVSDLHASRRLYTAALAPLGFEELYV